MTTRQSIDFWPESRILSYEMQRVLAMAPYGGGDPGEILWTAARIDPRDPESWQKEWAATARECEAIAENAASWRTARDANLRACNYWRQAAFFIPFTDPRLADCHRNSQRCFRAALPRLDTPAEIVEIPYEGRILDGYLLQPAAGAAKPAPVVIFGGTVDSTSEEKYFALGRLLTQCGIAVLLWDGPGQGASLIQRGVESRADQHVAVSATIDWIEQRPELDHRRIGLIGWGGGGFYTLETAAHEPRLTAGVAWCMAYDFMDPSEPWVPGGVESREDWLEKAMSGALGDPIQMRYGYEWATKRTPGDLAAILAEGRAHTLKGLLDKATCSILILMGGEDAVSFGGDGAPVMDMAQRALDELASTDKTLVRFPAEGPGSRHVQADGMERGRAIISDWLIDRLGVDPDFQANRDSSKGGVQ